MTRRLRELAPALVTAIACGAALAACSSPPAAADATSEQVASAGAQLVELADVDKEYTDTIARLMLPQGASVAKRVPRPTEATKYERGFGVGMAERQWICAWEREWLHTLNVDSSRAQAALTQLGAAPKTLFMSRQLDEAGRRMFADYLSKAKLGHPSGLQNDVDLNCS